MGDARGSSLDEDSPPQVGDFTANGREVHLLVNPSENQTLRRDDKKRTEAALFAGLGPPRRAARGLTAIRPAQQVKDACLSEFAHANHEVALTARRPRCQPTDISLEAKNRKRVY